jgi:hypothetical protein
MPIDRELRVLLRLLDEAFDARAWHGTPLRGSVRGVSAKQAAWRPAANRHNIWELVVHCAYWKHAVRRRLTGEKRGSFASKGSNWFRRPASPGAAGDDAWRGDVALLLEEHRKLRVAVERLQPSGLHRSQRGSKYTPLAHVLGIAAHDLYHAGQIQILKRLARS